jgi:hypothetical protein
MSSPAASSSGGSRERRYGVQTDEAKCWGGSTRRAESNGGTHGSIWSSDGGRRRGQAEASSGISNAAATGHGELMRRGEEEWGLTDVAEKARGRLEVAGDERIGGGSGGRRRGRRGRGRRLGASSGK